MATEKSALRVTELDFESIRNNLKNYLKSQSEFTDYDFEGSGMSVLLDILAYNTHYMGFYLNMVGNEMFLDTAQIRASILSLAKSINYIPKSKRGAEAVVNIKVTPSTEENQTNQTLTLEKYTKFLGTDIDGVNYQFVTPYANTVSKTGNNFYFSNVRIRQGEVISLQYEMTSQNEFRRFEIPSANVDIDSLVITVQESSTNPNTSVYALAEDITELNSLSQVYFVEENENLNYTFYFGDDVIGKKPKNGNIITATYLDNTGTDSNNISKFVTVEPVGDLYSDNVAITTMSSSSGGVDKETIEQVRFRAPYFYTAQNRAVTKKDYETLILKDFPNVESISVWGGEDNDPVVYGKIYLSMKTKGTYALSNLDKEIIKSQLKERNVFTVIPEIVDPNYSYITLTGRVYYNPTLTSLSVDQILQLVKSAILDYSNDELTGFDSVFRKSKLQYYIENAEKSITGSDIDVYMQKRVELTIDKTSNYSLIYDAILRKGDFNQKISSFPQVTVRDSDGIARDIFFEEVPQAFTGIDSISIINPGINYDEAPTVVITGDGMGATAVAKIVNGKLDNITVTSKGSNYTRASVSLVGGGGSQASAQAIIQNNNGIIRSYYFKPNGEKVIIDDTAGFIDYMTGKLDIRELLPIAVVENDFYDENVLTIKAPVEQENIYPFRNRIVTIDENDASSIQIELIAE